MPIDYEGLVTGLGEVAGLVGREPELVAVDALVTRLCEATGATGGTFTEYGEGGGRVVAARGAMLWALGRPAPAQLVHPDIIGSPFSGWVESMPPEAAGQLLARGLVAVSGHPVRVGERVAGAVHLYFREIDELDWPEVETALRVVASLSSGVYTGREAARVRSPVEEDDRSLFLMAAGHELRTPVTVIKGYAGLLADRWEFLTEEQRRSATKVLTQRADELARLVDRLLTTSVGETLVRTMPFDLRDALVGAAEAMPAETRRTIRLEVPNWLPPASGDPEVIGTVVRELVTNAVRASAGGAEPGPSSVDVSAGADADTAYIRVLDRGVGIDPADVEQAFERFWRGQQATPGGEHDPRAGVGLGLYLVRRLVERQNGWVSLRPREGGGTIAEVRLARADRPPRPAASPENGQAKGEPGSRGVAEPTERAQRVSMAVQGRGDSDAGPDWSMAVPHHASGARHARQRLAAELDRLVPPGLRADVVAVAAELLGNAVRHAAPLPGNVIRLGCRVHTDASGTVVDLRVNDGGSALVPRERTPEPDSPDGRGLTIVAALARSWGVERSPAGQCVWAQLSAPAIASPGA
jgi:two-component system, OmpR family, phosphate regulon sensor histidine kinase PhoR